jgi:hypothetical protein
MDDITDILTTFFVDPKYHKKQNKMEKISEISSSTQTTSSTSSISSTSQSISASESDSLNYIILHEDNFKDLFKLLIQSLSTINEEYYKVASVITSTYTSEFKILKLRVENDIINQYKIFDYDELELLNVHEKNKKFLIIVYLNNQEEYEYIKAFIEKNKSFHLQFILTSTNEDFLEF